MAIDTAVKGRGSRKGKDMYMFLSYSEQREEWFWGSKHKNGKWLIRKWKKGD